MVIIWVALKSKKIFTVSEYVKQDLANFAHINTGKIVVTYNSADFIKNKPSPVKSLTGKVFIFYVGQAFNHKNIRRLIDAFALVQQTHPTLHLALAGRFNALYQAHKEYADSKGIKNIVFTDYLDDGQLRWMYENTAAYVFPSLSEGFGLPGLEAMVHGAPVVSSNATCLPEIYGDAAVYFDPLSPEDMAEKITKIIKDKRLSAELVAKGYDQVKKYSWDKMAQITLATYKQILNK